MKKYYLAYGSNLNLNQMKYRCPSAKPIGTFNLEGYRLVYKGSENGYAYLTIEPDEKSFVPLGIFKLSLTDINYLDFYEGYPSFYSKIDIPIKVKGKNRNALIYIMNEGFDYHVPSKEYIETCMEGYKDFNFDMSILEKALKDTYDNLEKNKTK